MRLVPSSPLGRCTKTLVSCVLVAALLAPPSATLAWAQSGADVTKEASNLYNTLNPINIALGPLIDRAASDADSVLQARLEQLHGIIQEALYTLDQIAKTRIEQINQDTKDRLNQLQAATSQAIQQLNDLAADRITQIDDSMQARIDQLGNAAGNLVASLPIPIEPILNVGTQGITTYKNVGDYTTVFVAGSGLRKDGYQPLAWVEKPGAKSTSWWSVGNADPNVVVASASMGLVQLRIPNSLLPDSSSALDYVIRMKLLRGYSFGVFRSYTEESFPLHICTSVKHYSVEVKQTASGQYWDRRTVPVPGAVFTKGLPDGFYIDDNGGNNHRDVCALDFDGYAVDTDPAPGFQSGLTVGAEGGDHYHNVTWAIPHPGCIHLYCDNRDGGSNEWIAKVYERQKRVLPTDQCAEPVLVKKDLKYSTSNQIQLDPQKAIGRCGEAGLSASPNLTTHLDIRDSQGNIVDSLTVNSNSSQHALNGAVSVNMDSTGLMKITIKPACRWTYDAVVK
jgi:hypothetical protein